MLEDLASRLDVKGVKLDITQEVKEKILEKGYKPKYGARPLRRAIQSMLEDKLADFMLSEKIESENSQINVNLQGEELELALAAD